MTDTTQGVEEQSADLLPKPPLKGDEEEKVKEEKKLKILPWNKLLNDSTVPKFVASVSK